MIRFNCPGCQSKLSAKDKLAGHARKCPKCGTEVRIPDASSEPAAPVLSEFEGPDDATAAAPRVEALQEGLPRFQGPKHLVRTNQYLICDRGSVFAFWADGSGWMLRTNAGPLSAPRNPDMLPSEGNFVLVELIMERDDEGLHLRGVACHKLATRYSLLELEKEEDKVLRKVVAHGSLSRDQKIAVLRYIKERFMPEVWENAQNVRDFLTNDDHTSSGTEPLPR